MRKGAIAQLGERLPCTQEVCGSIPHSSTIIVASIEARNSVSLTRNESDYFWLFTARMFFNKINVIAKFKS